MPHRRQNAGRMPHRAVGAGVDGGRRQEGDVGQQPQEHDRGNALGRQQPDQHHQLEAGRRQRAGAPEQGTDKRPGQGDQPGGAGLVKRRHQRLGDRDADQVGGGLPRGRPQGQLALDLGTAAAQFGHKAAAGQRRGGHGTAHGDANEGHHVPDLQRQRAGGEDHARRHRRAGGHRRDHGDGPPPAAPGGQLRQPGGDGRRGRSHHHRKHRQHRQGRPEHRPQHQADREELDRTPGGRPHHRAGLAYAVHQRHHPSHEEQDRQRQDGPGNLVHPLTALCPSWPLGCSG